MKPYRNHKGQIVGHLYDDGVFRKRVSARVHLFKKDNAWGIDKKILEDLPDGTEIRILDMDDNTIYYTTKERFKTGCGIDYRHGNQITFWRGFFDTSKDGVRVDSPHVEYWMESHAMFEAHGV